MTTCDKAPLKIGTLWLLSVKQNGNHPQQLALFFEKDVVG
jgi:hypothetical protein